MILLYILPLLFVIFTMCQLASGYSYDDTEYIIQKSFGHASMDLYVRAFDIFFYSYYGAATQCEPGHPSDPTTKCDIIMYARICILKEEFIGKVKPGKYKGSTYTTFDIDRITGAAISKNVLEGKFNCGPAQSAKLSQHKNADSFDGNGRLLSSYNGVFGDMYQFTGIIAEMAFWNPVTHEPLANFYPYQSNSYCEYIQVSKNTDFRSIKYFEFFKTDVMVDFRVISKCKPYWYGKTCWFYCKDDVTKLCNCAPIQTDDVNCDIQCRRGYIGSTIVYHLSHLNINSSKVACNRTDKCLTLVCKATEECFALDSNTAYCVNYKFEFFYNFKNVTGNTFLYNTKVEINLDRSIKPPVMLKLPSFDVQMQLDDMLSNHFELINYLKIVLLHLHDELFIDKYTTIHLHIFLPTWRKIINKTKTFKVLAQPTEALLTNIYKNKTYVIWIYLGETLLCISNGKPKYRIVFHYITEINLTNVMSHNQTILPETKLGKTVITCNFTLISYDLGLLSYVHVAPVYVKAFVYFKWNSSCNVFSEGNVLSCISLEYIPSTKKIIQIQGETFIKVIDNIVLLSNIEGGTYVLICVWKASLKLIYSKRIRFMFAKKPKYPCTLFYVPTYGSLVQCGHDGYPHDEYRITTSILVKNVDIMDMLVSGNNFVRIPYAVEDIFFYVKCEIESPRYGSFVPFSFVKSHYIYRGIKHKYSLVNSTKMCHSKMHNVEPLDVITLNQKQRIVKVVIFKLEENSFEIIDLVVRILVFLCILMFAVWGFAITLRTLQGTGLRLAITRAYHMLKRNNLLERIIFEIRVNNRLNTSLQIKFRLISMSSSYSRDA